jgi:glucokinase
MTQSQQSISAAEAVAPLFVGIDLGGNSIKIGVVDDLGRPLCALAVPTEIPRGPEEAAKRMGAGVGEAIRRAGLQPSAIARVGLGSPGTMDLAAGMLIGPVNLKGWENFPIRDRVACHCGLPVTFANDADAAAYGEFWVGAGRGFHSLVLFTLGTGIGCGIVLGENYVSGAHSHGAECGHIVIDFHENARLCGCGQRGHLEAYASALAVVARTREALAAGRKSSLAQRLAAGEELTPKLLAEQAEADDELSLEIILDTAAYLGVGVVNLLHTVDPSGVLLGGAMTFGGRESALGCRFLARVQEEIRRRAFPILAERTKIDFAALGGDAGFIGAAGLARLEHRKAA